MTVTELHVRLTELIDEGKGDFVLFDTNAFPIISAVVSEDDMSNMDPAGTNELNRVYIESEF